MRTLLKSYVFLLCLGISMFAKGQTSFRIIPLGVYGGIREDNLSAYLLQAHYSEKMICLDAGTLHQGITVALKKHTLNVNEQQLMRNHIKAYMISHGHLDHLAGMVINSPEDSSKNIYALPFCIDVLKNNYFTWSSWANFANEGEKPQLNKYRYQYLQPKVEVPIEHTTLKVTAFELSHAKPGKSTAFLIRNNDNYFLYLGDTGDDQIENATNMDALWEAVAPLVKAKKLKGIAIEVSFPNRQPEHTLFGHLTPKLCYKNLQLLAEKAGVNNLHQLPILVTHIKPIGNNEHLIKKEMKKANTLKVKLIFPKQGEAIQL